MDHYHLRGWKIWFSLDQHTLSEPGRCHLLWDNFSRWSLVTCLPAVLIKLSGAYWTQQHFFSYFVRKVPPLLSLHRAVKAVHLQTQLLWLWVIQETFTFHSSSLPGSHLCIWQEVHFKLQLPLSPHFRLLSLPYSLSSSSLFHQAPETMLVWTPAHHLHPKKGLSGKMLYDSIFLELN